MCSNLRRFMGQRYHSPHCGGNPQRVQRAPQAAITTLLHRGSHVSVGSTSPGAVLGKERGVSWEFFVSHGILYDKWMTKRNKGLAELKGALKGMPSDNLREKQDRDIGRCSELTIDERQVRRPKKRPADRPQT